MLFSRNNKKIDEMKNKSYPKSEGNRKNYITSFPIPTAEVIDHMADTICHGNKSLLLRLIIMDWMDAHKINHLGAI